jgi:predicted peroxiredoxin
MGVSVYASDLSLNAYRMRTEDVVEGVKAVSGTELAGLLKEAKTTMIF